MKYRAHLSGLVLIALCGCSAATTPGVTDLSAKPDAAIHVELDQVQRSDVVEKTADGIAQGRYAFQPGAHPQIVIAPANAAWDWTKQGELHLRVQNAMPWAVTLTIEIDGADAQHALQATVGVPAGPPQTVVVPLHATSSRTQGMQVGPTTPFDDHGQSMLLATTVKGALDLHAVHAIRLGMPAPQAAQTLLLGRIDAVQGDPITREAYTGIVDQYGQYTHGNWPERIASDTALKSAHAGEQMALAAAPSNPGELDVYGGHTDIQGLQKTGWFHTQKLDGHWRLVTPEGHAFFSLGVNAIVSDDSRTYVEGRGFMFNDLPPDSGEWTSFYGTGDSRQPGRAASSNMGYNHGRWFDFYGANLYRVDGKNWLATWRQRTLDRLQHWGFNTIGNWSDSALAKAHRLPYTRLLNINGHFGSVSSGYDYWGRMPDPFDPGFAPAAEAAATKASAEFRDDPWLLGYFVDNELAWAGQGPQGHWGLAVGTLRGDAKSPAKQAFIAALRAKYATPEKLAAAWGIALKSWDALNATNFAAPAPNEAHPAIATDYSAWLSQYAETYFRVAADAIHRHDTHHLFLGGRFAVKTPEAIAACAKYCDVVSFNVYADLPQHGYDAAAMHALNKPVMITEFHFGSNDRGPFGNGVVSVENEQQRGVAYARYVNAAVNDPDIVGTHWFNYSDQPVTGRILDGENSHIGLVGITDIPFAGFVEAVRRANRSAGGAAADK
ncbi:beta-galactosidase [Rhodanobacter sp. L36]|uniref:beta-galactosidase n=1 Tax=Rhodanobacter sp. L36 TaxID=1747221 RepID=UPI00131C6B02|nr:beta-galactosidase [Rhodanobacter sp. L36]